MEGPTNQRDCAAHPATAEEPSARAAALARGERMEVPGQDEATLSSALAHVERATRWGGGLRSLTSELRSFTRSTATDCTDSFGTPRSFRLLDVGAGSGGIARSLATAASSDSATWRAFGVDNHGTVVGIAQRGTPPGDPGPVQADARSLPFPDDSFDAVLCNLTLHHFGEGDATCIVREMARVSRGLVLVADLERGRWALLGARLLSWTLWSLNPLVRHDGPVSVMRGFTAKELQAIAENAGIHSPDVRRVPLFRLLLSAREGLPSGPRLRSDPVTPQ